MNDYLYINEPRYFGQIAGGMEELGGEELKELGAKNIKVAYRGLYFDADKEVLYRIVLSARLFSRILIPLKKFPCHSTKYLYKISKEIFWDDFLTNDTTFAISSSVSNSKIKHSQYASQVLKDAIVDFFRDKTSYN